MQALYHRDTPLKLDQDNALELAAHEIRLQYAHT